MRAGGLSQAGGKLPSKRSLAGLVIGVVLLFAFIFLFRSAPPLPPSNNSMKSTEGQSIAHSRSQPLPKDIEEVQDVESKEEVEDELDTEEILETTTNNRNAHHGRMMKRLNGVPRRSGELDMSRNFLSCPRPPSSRTYYWFRKRIEFFVPSLRVTKTIPYD